MEAVPLSGLAAPVMTEAVIAASLSPLLPVVAGVAELGAVTWRLVGWWKATSAAAAAKAAAALTATADVGKAAVVKAVAAAPEAAKVVSM
jgi:hypothetical protein